MRGSRAHACESERKSRDVDPRSHVDKAEKRLASLNPTGRFFVILFSLGLGDDGFSFSGTSQRLGTNEACHRGSFSPIIALLLNWKQT